MADWRRGCTEDDGERKKMAENSGWLRQAEDSPLGGGAKSGTGNRPSDSGQKNVFRDIG